MVVLHAMAIILNCRHAIWKNVQLGPVIGDIQSVKNTDSGRVKHCFQQQFQVEQQTNACYTVESQVKALTIQTVMSQLVRFRWSDCWVTKWELKTLTNLGTSCSYEDPHLFCIQRECKRVGCDHRIGSVKSYNNCGICGGSESDCDYVRLPKKKVARFRNSKL